MIKIGRIYEVLGGNRYKVDVGKRELDSDTYVCTPLSQSSAVEVGTGFVPKYTVNDTVMIFTEGSHGYILGATTHHIEPLAGEFLMTTPEGAMLHLGARPEAAASGSETGNVTIAGDRVGIVSGDEYKDWALETNRQYVFDGEDEDRDVDDIPSVPDEGVFVIRKDGTDLVTISIASGSVTLTTTENIYFNTSDVTKDPVVEGDTISFSGGTFTFATMVIPAHIHVTPSGPSGLPSSPETNVTGTISNIQNTQVTTVPTKTVKIE